MQITFNYCIVSMAIKKDILLGMHKKIHEVKLRSRIMRDPVENVNQCDYDV